MTTEEEIEEKAKKEFKKKPMGYEMNPELNIYIDGFVEGYKQGEHDNNICAGCKDPKQCFTSNSDKRLEPILEKLKDLGVVRSWYYNGSYHAC